MALGGIPRKISGCRIGSGKYLSLIKIFTRTMGKSTLKPA